MNSLRGWGFKLADFPNADVNFTPQTATEMLMLAVYLPGKGRFRDFEWTFEELWNLIDQKSNARLGDSSLSDRLAPASSKPCVPGIRWVAIDLFANWKPEAGRSVTDLRRRKGVYALAASEILMAAVLFPGWLEAMDGVTTPYANLAGYIVHAPRSNDWSYCPILYKRDDGKLVKLDTFAVDVPETKYAAPTVRELN